MGRLTIAEAENLLKSEVIDEDALEEMNLLSETHVRTTRINIEANKRFYDLPKEAVKILDIRCKDHNNDLGNYQSIPRSIFEPATEDTDGV